MPRLREMLSEGGLNLGDVDVSHDDAGTGQRFADGDAGGDRQRGSGNPSQSGTASVSGPAVNASITSTGLVDAYV